MIFRCRKCNGICSELFYFKQREYWKGHRKHLETEGTDDIETSRLQTCHGLYPANRVLCRKCDTTYKAIMKEEDENED